MVEYQLVKNATESALTKVDYTVYALSYNSAIALVKDLHGVQTFGPNYVKVNATGITYGSYTFVIKGTVDTQECEVNVNANTFDEAVTVAKKYYRNRVITYTLVQCIPNYGYHV